MEAPRLPPDLRTLVNDSAWLPHAYVAKTDSLVFARVPRETQRRATFLFDEKLGDVPKSAPIPIHTLPARDVGAAAKPLHFIFHTGFSCSTLLCRALDFPGVSMALKEPAVLTSFADLILSRKETQSSRDAFGIVLDLLSRPLSPGESQIVKTTYSDVVLAPQILAHDPATRVLILYCTLEDFVRSIAKREFRGRTFIRWLYQRLAPALALNTGYSEADLFGLTDLQVAALVWLMQIQRFSTLKQEYGVERIRTVSADALLSQKAGALRGIGGFFDLKADAAAWEAIALGPAFENHAKRPGDRFSATMREADHGRVSAVHAGEIAMVGEWTRAVASHFGVSMDLGATVFS
jgi:hypothetical protein